ncbi:MAG: hypothetical protein ACLRM8_05695 [Alistipes sp.]
MPGDPGLLRQNGPQGRLQGRRRGPHGRDAALYYTIVEEILGKEWLTTELFRIGPLRPRTTFFRPSKAPEVKYF